MINLSEVGAFPTLDASGRFTVQFGVYLPGLRASDGFAVIVRVIHSNDRFNPAIPPRDFPLQWQEGSALDLWSAQVPINPVPETNFGNEGTYLYRYQLLWAAPDEQPKNVVTKWFTDPFARATDVGSLSAFTLAKNTAPFAWSDSGYKTPELNDLIVYELHTAQFNDTFRGIIDRLDYLQSLGVNCLELMPVTSHKVDFDWGYGPLHYFAPSAHFGGADGLKQLINACHGRGVAVILDVVYQHVDPSFPYSLVYQGVAQTQGAPPVASPMIGAMGLFGPRCDFSQTFTQDYFQVANQTWLTEYHVDGFRYDEVTDYYFSPADTAYAKLAYDTYKFSLGIDRFRQAGSGYSRIIQVAEALYKARDVLASTYSNAAWQDDLLNKSEGMVAASSIDETFAHLLDVNWMGYPLTKTVEDAKGNPVEMPVSPFQYLESHDHSQLIVFTGTEGSDTLSPGNRDNFYRLQPYAIALYTAQGIPMLWEGQEFADNYPLPSNGSARVGLRRDTHWEFFYDDPGSALIRLYRRLGTLRRSSRALRSRDSFFYNQQSLQGTAILAYHRHAAIDATHTEEFVMVFLNFGDSASSISLPFPKAGTYREMLDDDIRQTSFDLTVRSDGESHTIIVPSHYGMVFLKIA